MYRSPFSIAPLAAGMSLGIATWSCASLDGLAGGPSPSSATCGNGIVEPGEECDGDLCCTQACALAPAGTTCRSATSPCDIAELCTGSAPSCPEDVSSCGTACRPERPCVAGQSCTATDESGCTFACNCADENVYSCSNTCCPHPAVSGKACGATARCNDACGGSCTCDAGTWSCPRACRACPELERLPATGATCYADVGTACTYFVDAPLPVTKCLCSRGGAVDNKWTCSSLSAPDCATPAVHGQSCLAGTHCRDACGEGCTCVAGIWQCLGTCAACPSVEELPLGGATCFSTAGTTCTWITDTATVACTCTAMGTTNRWACL